MRARRRFSIKGFLIWNYRISPRVLKFPLTASSGFNIGPHSHAYLLCGSMCLCKGYGLGLISEEQEVGSSDSSLILQYSYHPAK